MQLADDTSATNIEFECGNGDPLTWDFGTESAESTENVGKESGWGSFKTNKMSQCQKDQAVCGIKAQIDQTKYGEDAVGLNDVTLYCCDLPLTKH